MQIGARRWQAGAPSTGSWTNWQTLTVAVEVSPGERLRLAWNDDRIGYPLRSLNLDQVSLTAG